MNKECTDAQVGMVRDQIKRRGITDPDLLQAFLAVQRDLFVSDTLKESSYEDRPLSIGFGQTISQPFIVALITQALLPIRGKKILEIGLGSGYQTAILSHLGACVYGVERIPELAQQALRLFSKLGYSAKIVVGDGSLGLPEEGPFDGIIISAACPQVPPPLISQLCAGGRLVIPLGSTLSQDLTMITKYEDDSQKKENLGCCVFVPLIGEYGFKS